MTGPSLSACVQRTAEPPIPLARTWAAAYTGEAGPPIDLTQAVPGYPPHPDLLARLAEAAGQAWSAGYGAIVEDANGTYTASIPSVNGATATGSSLQAAENNLDLRIDELV